jgi:nitrite reductase/ring-hydroxylating ferredoxin subunit
MAAHIYLITRSMKHEYFYAHAVGTGVALLRASMTAMSDSWKSYRGAPADGTILCEADDIAEGSVKSIKLSPAAFPILIVRSAGVLAAYVNACPHQYLPLDHRGDNVLSADGTVLRCTNHSAGFRVQDGVGVEGLGLNCGLDPIPPVVDSGGLIRVHATSGLEVRRENGSCPLPCK